MVYTTSMAGFDPTHSVKFDLPRGSVVAGGEQRHVLLPCSALDDLVLTAGTEAATSVGRALGAAVGEQVAERFGGIAALREAPVAQVVREMAGELATRGLGVASVERWGRALVVAIERPAVADLEFLAAIVEGMIAGASEAKVSCASLGRDGATVRILVAGERAVARARAMLDVGTPWGDVLVRLQKKGAGA
jgi:hypothetical protein